MEPDGRSDDAGGAPDETAGESIGLGLGENWNSASTSSLPASKPKRRFWESKSSTEKKSADSSKKSSEISSRKTMESTSSPRSKSPGLFGRLIGGGSSKSTTPPVPQLPTFVSDPSSDGPLEGTLTLVAAQRFLPLFPNVLALAVLLPLGTDAKSPSRLLRHAADTLLNFPIALEELDGYTTSWLQPVNGATVVYSSLAPLPSRLLDLLTRTCDAYFPNDAPPGAAGNGLPHPDEVLTGGAGEVAKAEEVLGPIVLLLRKLSLLAEPAGGLKDIILPYNMSVCSYVDVWSCTDGYDFAAIEQFRWSNARISSVISSDSSARYSSRTRRTASANSSSISAIEIPSYSAPKSATGTPQDSSRTSDNSSRLLKCHRLERTDSRHPRRRRERIVSPRWARTDLRGLDRPSWSNDSSIRSLEHTNSPPRRRRSK